MRSMGIREFLKEEDVGVGEFKSKSGSRKSKREADIEDL